MEHGDQGRIRRKLETRKVSVQGLLLAVCGLRYVLRKAEGRGREKNKRVRPNKYLVVTTREKLTENARKNVDKFLAVRLVAFEVRHDGVAC